MAAGKRIILVSNGAGSLRAMVYETRISSLKKLVAELQDLEADEGVRILTGRGGKKKIVFVTRHSGRYAIAICAAVAKGGEWLPGKVLQFKEFLDQKRLRDFLRSIGAEPLKAYLY